MQVYTFKITAHYTMTVFVVSSRDVVCVSAGWMSTYISVAMNPVSSDRNRNIIKTQHRMETVEEDRERRQQGKK